MGSYKCNWADTIAIIIVAIGVTFLVGVIANSSGYWNGYWRGWKEAKCDTIGGTIVDGTCVKELK